MDEFLRELFYFIMVEGGKLSEEDKYGLHSFLETWGELERTNSSFDEWLEKTGCKQEYDEFKKEFDY